MTYYFVKVFNSGRISEGRAILEMVATIDHRLWAANTEHRYEPRGWKKWLVNSFVPIKRREAFRLSGTAVFFSSDDFGFFIWKLSWLPMENALRIIRFNNLIDEIHSEEIQDAHRRSSWRLADRSCHEDQSWTTIGFIRLEHHRGSTIVAVSVWRRSKLVSRPRARHFPDLVTHNNIRMFTGTVDRSSRYHWSCQQKATSRIRNTSILAHSAPRITLAEGWNVTFALSCFFFRVQLRASISGSFATCYIANVLQIHVRGRRVPPTLCLHGGRSWVCF